MKPNGWREKELFVHIINIIYPIPANMTPPHTLVSPFQKIPFTNEEATGSINEAAIGANKGAKNRCFSFFYFRFYCFSNSIT